MPLPPFVSVVVPVRTGARTIGDCLASLVRNDYPEARREILVVTGDRIGRTAEIVARYPVRAVRETRPSLGHALNLGVAEARGELVAFTEADCTVSTAWLAELVRGFDTDDGVAAVAGEIVSYPPETLVQ